MFCSGKLSFLQATIERKGTFQVDYLHKMEMDLTKVGGRETSRDECSGRAKCSLPVWASLHGNADKSKSQKSKSLKEERDDVPKDESKGKKSKVSVADYAESEHWLEYFSPFAISDLTRFGVHVDWRRTFITTDRR
ncbi:hypothetical protein DMENIID0001_022970 [Sergentomyia squamirostris]